MMAHLHLGLLYITLTSLYVLYTQHTNHMYFTNCIYPLNLTLYTNHNYVYIYISYSYAYTFYVYTVTGALVALLLISQHPVVAPVEEEAGVPMPFSTVKKTTSAYIIVTITTIRHKILLLLIMITVTYPLT